MALVIVVPIFLAWLFLVVWSVRKEKASLRAFSASVERLAQRTAEFENGGVARLEALAREISEEQGELAATSAKAEQRQTLEIAIIQPIYYKVKVITPDYKVAQKELDRYLTEWSEKTREHISTKLFDSPAETKKAGAFESMPTSLGARLEHSSSAPKIKGNGERNMPRRGLTRFATS